MRAFACTIDMRELEGCRAREIVVRRSGYGTFWCRAILGPKTSPVELGPLLLGFDGTLTEQWSPAKHLVGDQLPAFLDALAGFLLQRGIISQAQRQVYQRPSSSRPARRPVAAPAVGIAQVAAW